MAISSAQALVDTLTIPSTVSPYDRNADLIAEARRVALEAQWKRDFATILAARAELRATLDAEMARPAKAAQPISHLTDVLAKSHLPATFVYGRGGINRDTGKSITGWQHVSQSLRDIITTPIGSRVMRRDYGSRIPLLIDRPMTLETLLDVYLATAEAIERWEPRFRLRNVSVKEATQAGRLTLYIDGTYHPRGHLGDFTAYQEPETLIINI